jgi:hypothetical protein
MPQLDLLTLFDQFLIAYCLFIILHFFISVGVVPTIFEALCARRYLFEDFFSRNEWSEVDYLKRIDRMEQECSILSRILLGSNGDLPGPWGW